jgi:hypothetical protein
VTSLATTPPTPITDTPLWVTIDPGGGLRSYLLPGPQPSYIFPNAILPTLSPTDPEDELRLLHLGDHGDMLHHVREAEPDAPPNPVASAVSGWLGRNAEELRGVVAVVGGWNPERNTYRPLEQRQLSVLSQFVNFAQDHEYWATGTNIVRRTIVRLPR